MDKKLLEPIEIKGMKLKNRIGFAPFVNMSVGEEGHISDLTIVAAAQVSLNGH